MMCTYGLGCDAVSYIGTDVPVLVSSFVMVVESTRLRISEALNLHHYHFEKPKSRKFFSIMCADTNNRVRISVHIPCWSRQEDLIVWNFGVRLSDCTGSHTRTGSLHKLLVLLEIGCSWLYAPCRLVKSSRVCEGLQCFHLQDQALQEEYSVEEATKRNFIYSHITLTSLKKNYNHQR